MLKTFSEDLKYFRESKNMTLKDVALDTRLNMAVLENLENGDFTFQPQTYIRAFLRQYAKSIGLSPDGILKDYEQAKAGNYSTKRLPPEEKLDAFEDIKKEKINEQPKLEVKKTKHEEVKKEEDVFDKFNIEDFKRHDDDKEIKETKKEEPKEKLKKEEPKEIIIEPTKEERQEVKQEEKEEVKKEEIKEEKKENKKSTDGFNFPPPREKKPIEIQREIEDKKNSTSDPDKRFIVKTKNVNSSALKTIFIVVIFLLIGAGVYSLVNVLFLGDNNKGPEIQRKSFDDVVKENEKKILGKKSPEEIQDSIKKAEEEKQKLLASKNDSLVIEIGAYRNTWIILDTDSTTIDDPKRVYLERGYTETYKAKKFFHLGTPNADLIEVKLNGKVLEFDRKNFRNLLIDKNGISEK
ncbi:MAG: helix-turn-helix domain-containing protein [Bacteroidetes bacterium]|nr:helix-turn-helix domain-containing protein [Bacteroidota bacterium]